MRRESMHLARGGRCLRYVISELATPDSASANAFAGLRTGKGSQGRGQAVRIELPRADHSLFYHFHSRL